MNKQIFQLVTIVAISLFLVLLSTSLVFADTTIDMAGIGKELTVHIKADWKISAYNHNERFEGDVFVEITKYGNVVDEGKCHIYKRTGHCSIPFKLTDGKYSPGWYDIKINMDGDEELKKVWIWKRLY